MASHRDPAPRLLLVEDDPVSSGFLRIALETLPASVDCCASGEAALALASARAYDLALIDLNLPDGSGSELLASLRHNQHDLPALAHTAELSAQTRRELRDNGFLDVLAKPLTTEQLLQAVRDGLGQRHSASQPASLQAATDWDEAAALLALNGQRSHLEALRELFLAELPGIRDAVDGALRDADLQRLGEHLHRLQASCAFVGASRLAGATRRLRSEPYAAAAGDQFREAVAALLP